MQDKSDAEISKIVSAIKRQRWASASFFVINGLFTLLNVSGLFARLNNITAAFVLFLFVLFFFASLIFLWKLHQKNQKIISSPYYSQALKSIQIKILNEKITPIYALQAIASVAIAIFVIVKFKAEELPPLIYIGIFLPLIVIVLWFIDLGMRASKEIREDELQVAKAKDSGYFGYYLGVILLVALLLTILWLPEFKVQITKNFAGFEIEIAIAFSIFALLIGGLLGRFVTWDKYR